MRKIVAAGAVFLIGVGFAVCWIGARSGQPEALHLHGVVEIQEVRLGSREGGRVSEVLVREGDLVEAGQPLVRIATPELELGHRQAQARLHAAEAELERARNGPRGEDIAAARAGMEAARARRDRLRAGYRAEEIAEARGGLLSLQAQLAHARREADREQRLYGSAAGAEAGYERALAERDRLEGQVLAARARLELLRAGSRPEDVAEAEALLAQAEAGHQLLLAGSRSEDIAAAQARVGELLASVQELEVRLREAVVRAEEPVLVEVAAVRPGDLVTPGQPLIRVLRAGDLWVKAYVPETELGKVRLGQAVAVGVDSYPGRKLAGRIGWIAAASEFTPRNVQSADERRHQVFAIKVHVADTQGILKSGMAAEVSIPTAE